MNIAPTGYWSADANRHDHHRFSRPLADWIGKYLLMVNYLRFRGPAYAYPIYDLGCGPGDYMKHLRHEFGFTNIMGFEGDPPVQRAYPIVRYDITKPIMSHLEPGHVICLEVGEHIPAQFSPGLIDNIKSLCDGSLILSWAVPGQGGTGHVNCLHNNQVIEMLNPDFEFHSDASNHARGIIRGGCDWFRNTLMIFSAMGPQVPVPVGT